MDDKVLLNVNCLISKRGRKKKFGDSRVSDEASQGGSQGRVKEEYD
jgi:hypothetical protein